MCPTRMPTRSPQIGQCPRLADVWRHMSKKPTEADMGRFVICALATLQAVTSPSQFGFQGKLWKCPGSQRQHRVCEPRGRESGPCLSSDELIPKRGRQLHTEFDDGGVFQVASRSPTSWRAKATQSDKWGEAPGATSALAAAVLAGASFARAVRS